MYCKEEKAQIDKDRGGKGGGERQHAWGLDVWPSGHGIGNVDVARTRDDSELEAGSLAICGSASAPARPGCWLLRAEAEQMRSQSRIADGVGSEASCRLIWLHLSGLQELLVVGLQLRGASPS